MDVDSFWARLVTNNTGCREWVGARSNNGYGNVAVGGTTWKAHRLAWTLFNGPIPDGLYVCHRCDNPPCCNPDHLFLGTPKQNQEDMHSKGRFRTARRVAGWRVASATLSRPRPEYRGSNNPNARLSRDDVQTIRERYASGGVSQAKIAAEYGVSQSVVSTIVRRKAWAA